MSIEVKLPDLGEGIESGDVLELLVAEGDTISKNQSIMELETDKATVEVPSSHAGKVVKIHVGSGQTVQVGGLLLTLEAESEVHAAPTPATPETPAAATAAPEAAPAQPTPAQPAPAQPNIPATQEALTPPPATISAPPPQAVPESPVLPVVPATPRQVGALSPAGPGVRRFAREAGVDLAHVVGSGPGGRITREDVMSAVRGGAQTVAQPTIHPSAQDAPPSLPPDVPANVDPLLPASPSDPAVSETLPGTPFRDEWGPLRIQPMARIRKTIAAKMHESWSSVPRVTNFDDADITELEEIRQASKKDYAQAGIKLTAMPFVIKAVAMSLQQHPLVNAAIDTDNSQIVFKDYVNVGIAVDTDRGLVVPSLRSPDAKSIAEIARGLADIAENARGNSFALEDLRGSTFTISNLGAVGGTYSTPIVNVPEVAILLLGRSRKLPVVVGNDIQVRLMMPLSLSYDHRLVDGATAARFLNDVIGYLAAPSRLLLAP